MSSKYPLLSVVHKIEYRGGPEPEVKHEEVVVNRLMREEVHMQVTAASWSRLMRWMTARLEETPATG